MKQPRSKLTWYQSTYSLSGGLFDKPESKGQSPSTPLPWVASLRED